jgi:deoxycytidylate deaminase
MTPMLTQTRNDRAHLEQALRLARRSTLRKHRLGCVIVKDGEVVSTGWAHEGGLNLCGLRSTHAEMHALMRARHLDLTGAVGYVACISARSGKHCLAKPCATCAAELLDRGIWTVHFTVETGISAVIDLEEETDTLKCYRGRSWGNPLAAVA